MTNSTKQVPEMTPLNVQGRTFWCDHCKTQVDVLTDNLDIVCGKCRSIIATYGAPKIADAVPVMTAQTRQHRCMRCRDVFDCLHGIHCTAKFDVLPRIVRPDGVSVVDHCPSVPEYKGFLARVRFTGEEFFGEVVGERDVITFEADEQDGVEQAFRDSVDDYLAMCEAPTKQTLAVMTEAHAEVLSGWLRRYAEDSIAAGDPKLTPDAKLTRQVAAIVDALASGSLRTYDPASQVVVSIEEARRASDLAFGTLHGDEREAREAALWLGRLVHLWLNPKAVEEKA